MVEPRFIYALMGIYEWAKDYVQVVKRLCVVRGKTFYGGEKLSYSLSIVLRFQLIVKGRAKIFQGVEFFLLNHMSFRCMHV